MWFLRFRVSLIYFSSIDILLWTGFADIVACFECGIIHRRWLKNDDPVKTHFMLQPECPYINELMREGIQSYEQLSRFEHESCEEVSQLFLFQALNQLTRYRGKQTKIHERIEKLQTWLFINTFFAQCIYLTYLTGLYIIWKNVKLPPHKVSLSIQYRFSKCWRAIRGQVWLGHFWNTSFELSNIKWLRFVTVIPFFVIPVNLCQESYWSKLSISNSWINFFYIYSRFPVNHKLKKKRTFTYVYISRKQNVLTITFI